MSDRPSQGLFPDRKSLFCLAAVVGILVVAAGVRILGALNDLWLDEIWSLQLVRQVSSPLGVFTQIHRENNHYLNSLCLYFLGPHGNWPGYRIPSLVAGLGAVILAWLIGRRRAVTCAFFAMLLLGFSYVMVLYSSEARGYAALVFFSLLSFYVLERHLEQPGWPTACLLSISETLGLLAQLSFVCFLGAALVWSGWRLVRANPGGRRGWAPLLACHALPLLTAGWLYFIDIRLMTMGGGTHSHVLKIYADSLAWTLGAPAGLPLPVTALLAAAMLGAGLWMLGRERSDRLVFFAGILVAPILMIQLVRVEVIYVRFFLTGMVFSMILISSLLARLYQRSGMGKGICLLFLAAYFLANGWQLMTLFRAGRGRDSEAGRFMIEHTKGPLVTIGCDNDFRVFIPLQLYVPEMKEKKPVEYCGMNSRPPGGPEWVVFHKESFEEPVAPGALIADEAGNHYELMKTYPTAPLSGLHWFIYHNRAR
jgi:hypothetical protein